MAKTAPTVTLKRGKEERLRGGHLWIYAGEIRSLDGTVEPGGMVDVRAADRSFLGRGYLNPRSTIAVRLLTRRREPIDEGFLLRRLQAALALRERVVAGTTAFRLVYSEGDGLPGLIVDRYGDLLVVQVLTLGMARWEATIVRLLSELVQPAAIYARNDMSARRLEGLPAESRFLRGAVPLRQRIEEAGLRFIVDVAGGQKTGFFLDQRENRRAAAGYARGEVLDVFCYTGAFALGAARAGAAVLGLDISAEAVAAAREHAALNGLADRCRFEEGDAFDALRALAREGPRFEMVILDPPAFAKSKAALAGAAAGYKEINLRAIKCLRPDGILVSCSCSAHVTEAMLLDIVAQAAADAARPLRLLEARTQARDHPIHPAMPETRYLKCLILAA